MSLLFIAITIGGAVVIFKALARYSRHRAQQVLMLKVNDIVGRKLEQLTRRCAQLAQPDAFGKPRMDKWTKEIHYFVQNHIACQLNMQEQELLSAAREEVVQLITERTYARMQAEPVFNASRIR
jgi:hypothetical protein